MTSYVQDDYVMVGGSRGRHAVNNTLACMLKPRRPLNFALLQYIPVRHLGSGLNPICSDINEPHVDVHVHGLSTSIS